ncbi:hypothetical protein PAHAL_1G389600 [Panicum hallii]|uniref:Uncharacterized protein n=1 Tax=Panicum hallii TaxID=206008 RepID=A0A2T8KXN1_9POAL|nr:hypothetical protein PAHAL_1G389600 [Panicum hallii]
MKAGGLRGADKGVVWMEATDDNSVGDDDTPGMRSCMRTTRVRARERSRVDEMGRA